MNAISRNRTFPLPSPSSQRKKTRAKQKAKRDIFGVSTIISFCFDKRFFGIKGFPAQHHEFKPFVNYRTKLARDFFGKGPD